MKLKGILLASAIGTMVLGLAVSVQFITAGGGIPRQWQILAGASYAPLGEAAYTGGQVSLKPVSDTQLAAVRVTVPEAMSTARRYIGPTSTDASSVTVLVGSFTDYDTMTTTSPAYVVTFSGLSLNFPSPVASRAPHIDHYESVAINAANGDYVEAFSSH
jgi:hypothetical protein